MNTLFVPTLLFTGAIALHNIVIMPPDSTAVNQWLTFLTPIALAVLGVIQLVSNKRTSEVKVELNHVKETVVETQKTAIATHTLTNSAMGAQLTNAVEAAEEKLVLLKVISGIRDTPADTEAISAAELKITQAKKLLQEHLVKQAAVDAKLPEAL